MRITISCAADYVLAKELHQFLSSHLITMELSMRNDELYVMASDMDIKDQVGRLLHSFLTYKKDEILALHNFDSVFVIGIAKDPEDIGLYRCSFCGFPFAVEEEMALHERTHVYASF